MTEEFPFEYEREYDDLWGANCSWRNRIKKSSRTIIIISIPMQDILGEG